jgi:glycosyltransferase involved in cell wall biosynthesis
VFLVCEPIALGMVHVPFNAALLQTIRFAFPNDTICFYATETHLNYVREQLTEESTDSIVWKKLALCSKHSGFYTRFFSDFRTVKFLLNELNEYPKKDVLALTGNASLLWALKFHVRVKHKDKRVQVINHGNFSTLHRTPRKSILNPFYYLGSLKTALRLCRNSSFQHIVLEEAVRDAILKNMPFLRDKVFVLDHPIPIDKQSIEINNFSPPIHFGFLGRATEKKGFSKYLDVASEISQRFPGQVKFHFIGWISDKQKRAINSKLGSLSDTPGTERMSRIEYVTRLKSLHFVCLFYDEYRKW